VASLVSRPLVALAKREFPRLMTNESSREDALQTLALTEHASKGEGAVDAARHALAWLEYEIGFVPRPPVCPKPRFYPGEGETSAKDRALEDAYILRVMTSGRRKFERRRVSVAA
jgi:hypothetical protein